MINFNPFRKGGGSSKRPTVDRVLTDFSDKNPSSVNCTLLNGQNGEGEPEDLDRAFIFHHGETVLIQDKAFYITTPDGVKAEESMLGKNEILHLWFLFNRIPHTIDCRVLGRIRFPDSIQEELAPRIPVGYKLRPVGAIRKQEKRQYLRYAHKAGQGNTRVYSQILFDLFVTKTDITFPETGSLPPHIADIHNFPYSETAEVANESPAEIVKFMKNAIRLNPRESRVVFVNKPSMDERTNKVALLDMGKSDVLGLETSKMDTKRDESRNFYIRKPPNMVADRKNQNSLTESDDIVLNFHTTVSSDSPTEYYELISEITRVGTENMTVRTNGDIRKEAGLPVQLADFGIGGIKMESSPTFMSYILGENHQSIPYEEKIKLLEDTCYLLSFYPKLRFTRETEVYQPDIPMKILAKIVRLETSGETEEGEDPNIKGFGMKFYYDPAEYSRDSYTYDRWEMIRDFKENKQFQEIHNSLNGLIAFLESANR